MNFFRKLKIHIDPESEKDQFEQQPEFAMAGEMEVDLPQNEVEKEEKDDYFDQLMDKNVRFEPEEALSMVDQSVAMPKTDELKLSVVETEKNIPKATVAMAKPLKKNSSKKSRIKATYDAPDEKCFWITDGPMLKNLWELKEELGKMTEEQFVFHTKREGNDFALWIKNVFADKLLARNISRVKTRASMIKVLEDYLM